jgi:hypothetical protein
MRLSAPIGADLFVGEDCAGRTDEDGTCFDLMSYMPGFQETDPDNNRLFIIEPTYFEDNWLVVVPARKEAGDTLENWVRRHVIAGARAEAAPRAITVASHPAIEAFVSTGEGEEIIVKFARYPKGGASEIYRSSRPGGMTFLVIEGPDRYAVALMRLPDRTREEFLSFYKDILETVMFE